MINKQENVAFWIVEIRTVSLQDYRSVVEVTISDFLTRSSVLCISALGMAFSVLHCECDEEFPWANQKGL